MWEATSFTWHQLRVQDMDLDATLTIPMRRRWPQDEPSLTLERRSPLIPTSSRSEFDITEDRVSKFAVLWLVPTPQKAQDNSHIRSDMLQRYPERQLFVQPQCTLVIASHSNLLPCVCWFSLGGCVFPLLRGSFGASRGWHFHSCTGNTSSGRKLFIPYNM